MYRVYLDDNIIHNPSATAQQGLSCEDMVVSQSINWEINQFTFKMSQKHPAYSKVHVLRSRVKVYDGNGELFVGRVIRVDKAFDNTITVTCEDRLAFLCDTVIEPIYTKGNNKYTSPPETDSILGWLKFWLETANTAHNKMVNDDSRKFYAGTSDKTGTLLFQTQEPTTPFELCKKLLEKIDGYLVLRIGSDGKQYIDFKSDFVDSTGAQIRSSQKIEFGKNILDIKNYLNGESLYTWLYPVGKLLDDPNKKHEGWQERRSILASGVSTTRYVKNETLESLYGRIIGTATWDDIDDPQTLKNLAQGMVNGQSLKTSLTITAFDLSILDSDISRIEVGQYVNVISKPHDLNVWLLCKEKSIDLTHPEKSTVTLGATQATISRAAAGWKD